MSWYPLLLGMHIALAVSLLAPSLLLPFLLDDGPGQRPGRLVRALLAVQGRGSFLLGLGLGGSGVGLLLVLGSQVLGKPWLLVALALYAANLAIAIALARPSLRRLAGIHSTGDPARWRRLARRQRYLAYGMGGLVGFIGLLMSLKPNLW